MLRSVISLLFFCLLTAYSYAQSDPLEFKKTTHDYGTVEDWENPTTEFTFVNEGDAPIMFLPTQPPKNVRIVTPPHSIRPGDSATIRVTYYTDKLGRFRQNIEVSHSGSKKPVRLQLKGEILSFSPNAQMACPRFQTGGQTSQKSLYPQTGKVINKKTKQPIPGAQVTFVNMGQTAAQPATNRRGRFSAQLPPGRYKVKAEAQGYHPNERNKYLKRHAAPITIALVPKKEETTTTTARRPTTPQELRKETPEKEKEENKTTETSKTPRQPTPPAVSSPPPDTPDTLIIAELPDTVNGRLNPQKYNSNNIVFLLDVSLSMDDPHKLPLLKKSMRQLVQLLRDSDRVALIKYSGLPYVDLESISASKKEAINKVIDSLQVIGLTQGVRGLKKAYEIAEQNYIEKGNNQIILATDGLFSERDKKNNDIYKTVRRKARKKGIMLSVIGFGSGETQEETEEAKELMEELADDGDGNYIHIRKSNMKKAEQALIEEIKSNSIKTKEEETSIFDRFR